MAVIALLPNKPTRVVNAATATGVAAADTFSFPARGDGGDRTLALSVIGLDAVPTTATADLECSADGGTTWQKHSNAIALAATTVATTQRVTNLVAGLLYRINLTTLTLGSATSVSVWATVN